MSVMTKQPAGDHVLEFARMWCSDIERAGAAAAAELGQLLTDDIGGHISVRSLADAQPRPGC